MTELPHDLAESVAAVLRRAATRCLETRESLARVVEERGRDIKLVADRELEAELSRELRMLMPLPVFGEEGGWSEQPRSADDMYWTIDPLDGSYNYRRGQPAFCSAVAVCRARTPLFGAVHDIASGDCYLGGIDLPATCNGRPIAISGIGSRNEACLMTGLPVGGGFDRQAMGRLAEGLSGWRKVRMIGSAALSLMHVASGRADFYREDGIYWWDVAAGLAIVTAAGGDFEVRGGSEPAAPLFVAAGSRQLLRDAGAAGTGR
ncbi:inositol monophosphatase [Microbaculum marinum]|uniref:Inositol monophosphatase n=1 Tax=Microbaculum marinum TaxID=1764581 RepID=A0AAW9RZ38_9HYPH